MADAHSPFWQGYAAIGDGMLYFHKAGLVFLATPKAGSTAIEQALTAKADIVFQNDPNFKHCMFQRYQWRVEKMISMFTDHVPETVAMIRNPEDWLGSWFRFRHGAWLNDTPRSTRGMSFDQFVDAYLSDPQPAFAAVGSQWKFLTHPRTGARVQHIFRYDAMPEFVAYLEMRLGWPIALERANVSPDWPLTLSAPMSARLRDHCARDYDLYENALSRAPG